MLVQLLKKYSALILLNLFLLVPNISFAAPSDCIQTHSDGTYNCTLAKSTWKTYYGGLGLYPTFDEARLAVVSYACASIASGTPLDACYEQENATTPTTLPVPGRACGTSPICNYFTYKTDDNTNNGGYVAMVYFPSSPPAGANVYGQTGGPLTHIRTCPANTTAVNPDSTSLTLCKPYFPMPDTGACSSGNSKISCQQIARGESKAGDPVDIASGSKTLVETDYVYNSAYPFVFKKYYGVQVNSWQHEYERSLSYSNTTQGELIIVSRQTFQNIAFKKISGVWTELNSKTGTTLTQTGNNFTYKNENDEVEYYTNLSGAFSSFTQFVLTSVTKPNGAVFLLEYDSQGLLNKIKDPYLNEFDIVTSKTVSGCNSIPKITSITGPGSKTTSYTYTGSCLLTKTTYPDSTFRQYTYGTFTLADVKDENNNVIQSTYYTASPGGLYFVVTSEGQGSSGNIDAVSFSSRSTTQVTVTDARSNSVVVGFTGTSPNFKITGYSTQCTFCNGIQGSSISYDSNGFVSSVTDYRGYITKYNWNNKGQLLNKTEAFGTPLAKTITNTYGTNNLIDTSSEPVTGGNKVTTYTYTNNLLTDIAVTAPVNGISETRNTTLAYNALGELVHMFGPRFATVNDKLTMTYNSSGQVNSVTNGLNQTINYSDFNDYGKPQKVTHPSGNLYELTYDSRNRLTRTTFKSSITSNDPEHTNFIYDNAGQVTGIIYPNGTSVQLYYDTAHRLIKIEDYDENITYLGKTEFTLDNMSNITSTKIYNASNSQIRVNNAQYDNKNRLFKSIGNLNQTTTQTYDANSNLTQVTDAANFNTTYSYDALNRLSSQTNPDTGVISIGYTPDDKVSSVTDPKGLVTSYTYNGFGEVLAINSPDTGTTTMQYDKAGNIVQKTDSNNQTTTYTYDALNRVTNINYGNSQDTLTYDNCFIGKLCTITDSSGQTSYTYNKGRIASKNFTSGGFIQTVSYGYTNGQLTSMTYPSGRQINYTLSNGKIKAITDSALGSIISNAVYDPFSSEPKSYNWGSQSYTKTFTQDGVPDNIANTLGYSTGYIYDSRYNITNLNSTKNAVATYDNKSRITNYNYDSNNSSYTYNTSDDRLTKNSAGINYTHVYPANSHRLTSAGADNYTYDNNGNILSSSLLTFTYDKNRMASSTASGITTNYLYNALGQRVKKSSPNETYWYIYDEAGQLIAEYDSNGLTNEYIYMQDKPVAVIKNNVLYHIQTDHLNTPRTITNASQVVWEWENKEPFGANDPNANLSGSVFTFNLRFPGQYYDSEKWTNYNYFRDYAAGLGRYMQSDPIGLAGGINTYGYVGGNSLSRTDSLGLDIEYANHLVAFGNYHSKIIITPNNQELYKNDSRFERKDANGKRYATLGAGPSFNLNQSKISLFAKLNRDEDVKIAGNYRQKLALPCLYNNEDEAINNLFMLLNNYNTNNYWYTLIPHQIFGIPTGYNSNSFISSLGMAAGFQMPDPNNTGANTPGYENIIPARRFIK